jgi:hypothetical protein
MKLQSFVFSGIALGGAVLLLAPAQPSLAFSKIGGSLGIGQRDFRINQSTFNDAAANNNLTPHAMFPGQLGANMAIWKGVAEWGSGPHGDGLGDPLQSNVLGSGLGNFDSLFSGLCTSTGTQDDNTINIQANCGGGGTLAFTETGISNGWRMFFCDEWVWADGPSTIGGGQFDIQAVAAHEYGHSLGLGHSNQAQPIPTMTAAIAPGQTNIRSIDTDDRNGLHCIYGAKAGTKPVICGVSFPGGGMMTITGTGFDLSANDVWFTNLAPTSGSLADPRIIVSGVASSGGTSITLAIPGTAGPGEVIVRLPGTGGDKLSNAFPTDLATNFSVTPCGSLSITGITPNVIDALVPGTNEFMTITGTRMSTVTSIMINLDVVPTSRWTIVDDSTITMDPPQVPFLGTQPITLSDGTLSVVSSFDIVVPSTPQLEIGNGDPAAQNFVANGQMFNAIVGGTPGEVHRIYYSDSNVPSMHPLVSFCLGNNFTSLFVATSMTVGAPGYTQTSFPLSFSGSPMVFYSQSLNLSQPANPMFQTSNCQSVTLTP